MHAGARVHGAEADRRLSPPESHDLAGALWRRKGPGEEREGRGRRQVRVGSEGRGRTVLTERVLYTILLLAGFLCPRGCPCICLCKCMSVCMSMGQLMNKSLRENL